MKDIYLDYAATTSIDKRVLKKMLPYLGGSFGNPSSLYSIGREARSAIERSRAAVARVLRASPAEIVFTGSGTESDNLAILGIARAYKNKGNHIIVSKIEHKAVLEAAKKLEKEGFDVTYLDVDPKGIVKLSELKRSLRPGTILVSIMYANNEIGAIQPIPEIAKIIKKFRKGSPLPFFHTDACQAAGALDLDVARLGVDALTLNGSKIYGPKGIGCLYRSAKMKLDPLIVGGGQENNIRAGTENTAFIVGFAEALTLADAMKEKEDKRLTALRNYFIKKITATASGVTLNGGIEKRLPNNINISVAGIEGESLLLMLDNENIFVATGSACASTTLTPSHVLLAIGLKPETAHSSVRITLGRSTTKKDLARVIAVLSRSIRTLRSFSPIHQYNEHEKR